MHGCGRRIATSVSRNYFRIAELEARVEQPHGGFVNACPAASHGRSESSAGKAVIVTGAGSGIGRQTAVQFAREGGRVVVADIDAEGAKHSVSLIQAEGGDARVSVTDVSDADAVESMITETMAAYGRLDVLHNNAYWAPLSTTLTETTLEQWNRTIAVTLTGVFLGCKFAIPHMIAAGGGVIVNTASTATRADEIVGWLADPRYARVMTSELTGADTR